jgi:endonuclease-3
VTDDDANAAGGGEAGRTTIGELGVDVDGPTAERGSGGSYTLLFELPEPVRIDAGALGGCGLDAGWYGYTGSALGAGGFARIDRHERVAAGDHEVRHWHVDYLGGHPGVELREAVTAPGRDVECAVARALGGGPVDGFGASDCDCRSHLTRRETETALRGAVIDAYAAVCEE